MPSNNENKYENQLLIYVRSDFVRISCDYEANIWCIVRRPASIWYTNVIKTAASTAVTPSSFAIRNLNLLKSMTPSMTRLNQDAQTSRASYWHQRFIDISRYSEKFSQYPAFRFVKSALWPLAFLTIAYEVSLHGDLLRLNNFFEWDRLLKMTLELILRVIVHSMI